MAQLTSPVLTITRTGTRATLTVRVSVVLDAANEIPMARRGGSLAVICEIREWDRGGTWLRRPVALLPEQVLQGSDFGGGRVADLVFTVQVSKKDLNEDLMGRDEIMAVTWLMDLRGARRVETDVTQSGRVRVPKR